MRQRPAPLTPCRSPQRTSTSRSQQYTRKPGKSSRPRICVRSVCVRVYVRACMRKLGCLCFCLCVSASVSGCVHTYRMHPNSGQFSRVVSMRLTWRVTHTPTFPHTHNAHQQRSILRSSLHAIDRESRKVTKGGAVGVGRYALDLVSKQHEERRNQNGIGNGTGKLR